MTMIRQKFCLAVCCAVLPTPLIRAAERPNVLVILTDDQGWADIGYNNPEKVHGFDNSYGSISGAVGMYDHRYRPGKSSETWHRNQEIIPGYENGRHANEDEIEWFNDPKGIIQHEPEPDKRLFLAVVNHLDHAIGEVVKALDDSGQRANTLILFSSDNGPQGKWPGKAYPDDLKLAKLHRMFLKQRAQDLT
jgi:arylsulfatase A-like enzyme